MPTPFFKELSNEALRNEYWGYRELAYNNAKMAQGCAPRGHTINKLAGQMGKLMRNIEIIEAIARKRGISLAKTVKVERCAHCGAEGERTGHMTCQYPQNW